MISIYIKDSKSFTYLAATFPYRLILYVDMKYNPNIQTCNLSKQGTYQEIWWVIMGVGSVFAYSHQLNSSLFQSLSHLDTKFSLLWAPSHWFLVFSWVFFIYSCFHSCFPQCQLFSKFNLLNYSRGCPPNWLPSSLQVKKIDQPEGVSWVTKTQWFLFLGLLLSTTKAYARYFGINLNLTQQPTVTRACFFL